MTTHEELVGEAWAEVRSKVSRVRLIGTQDDGNQQLVDYKGVAGEQHTGVLRVQYFGLSSHAPAGSEGVLLSMGHRDMPLVVGAEHPDHRPTGLPEGGTRLYDAHGSYVDLDAAGAITAVSAASITIRSPSITLEGSVTIKGDIAHEGSMTTTGTHVDANGPHTA